MHRDEVVPLRMQVSCNFVRADVEREPERFLFSLVLRIARIEVVLAAERDREFIMRTPAERSGAAKLEAVVIDVRGLAAGLMAAVQARKSPDQGEIVFVLARFCLGSSWGGHG